MSADDGRPTISWSTRVYILVVCVACVAALVSALRAGAWPPGDVLLALLVLSAVVWAVGDSRVEDQVGVSLVGILLLASAVLVGPLGAGLLGLVVAGLSRGHQPLSARLFNMALSSLLGVIAGFVYDWAGGTADPERLRGLGPAASQLAFPLLVADLAQTLVNVVLIVGIMRISQGIPVRLTATRLLVTTGTFAIGYGLLAILLVLLWLPTALGPFSVVLLFIPLLGAQWALVQHTAQLRAQEEYLDLLVAAIELRFPERSGRASGVAELSGRMAEHLGLGMARVRDVARAGLLHDLEGAALPPSTRGEVSAAESIGGPALTRGPNLLDGVTFLSGTARVLRERSRMPSGAQGRSEGRGAAQLSVDAEIVAIAAAHDQAVREQGPSFDLDEFCTRWTSTHDPAPGLVDALRWSVERTGASS